MLQGTDTSGKDGTIRDVFNSTGPLGVHVTAFRAPSEEERAHDFLWRVHQAAPRRGTIGIFNRSHYEDVLVVKVRKLAPAEEIEARYGEINAFEKMLVENGTTVLKFMLHISKDEQRERLQARLEEPDKRWKFNPADLDDRRIGTTSGRLRDDANRCSTDWAPWHVIPADHKWVSTRPSRRSCARPSKRWTRATRCRSGTRNSSRSSERRDSVVVLRGSAPRSTSHEGGGAWHEPLHAKNAAANTIPSC